MSATQPARAQRVPGPDAVIASPRTAPGGVTDGRRNLGGALLVGLSPSSLLLALLYHPHIDDLRDKEAVAAALTGDTARWGIAHIAAGLAAALVLLAFLAVDEFLREEGRSRASTAGVPFVVVGSVLFAFLPAMEIAMLAVAETGGDVEAVMLAMNTWFVPVLVGGAATFGVGAVLYAVGVARSGVLGRGTTWLVVVAFAVAALARFAPFGAALVVGSAALVVALLPIAVVMATRGRRERP